MNDRGQERYHHEPTISQQIDGAWGVFCQACSYKESEYVYPCAEDEWQETPPARLAESNNEQQLQRPPGGHEKTYTLLQTRNASYVVDREGARWMRTSFTHPRHHDNYWVNGGFTLNDVGSSAVAHFADGSARLTSKVVKLREVRY